MKKLLKVLLVIFAALLSLLIFVSCFAGSGDSTEETETSKAVTLKDNFINFEATSPSTGEMLFTLNNPGEEPVKATCYYGMSKSGTDNYDGIKMMTVTLESGETKTFQKPIEIKNDGAIWVDTYMIDCE